MQEQLSHTSNSLAFAGLASDFLRKKYFSHTMEGCIVTKFKRKSGWRKRLGKSIHNLQGNMTQQTYFRWVSLQLFYDIHKDKISTQHFLCHLSNKKNPPGEVISDTPKLWHQAAITNLLQQIVQNMLLLIMLQRILPSPLMLSCFVVLQTTDGLFLSFETIFFSWDRGEPKLQFQK